MKKYGITLLLFIFTSCLFAQLGIKAGLNFANVSKASSINNSSRSGFHAGVFLDPQTKSIIGSRTELIFSRQGYDYKTNSNTGNVNLDYLMLPQYMTINITRYVSIQLGGQLAYLLNAKVDSTNSNSNGAYGNQLLELYNRFDYGYGGGVEVHPVSGLSVGARVNISLGNLYKEPASDASGDPGDFIPKVDVKNNVFQVYVGWTFGKESSASKKKRNEPEN